jgi:anaerobic selenocysteine-containing dehydrogenase
VQGSDKELGRLLAELQEGMVKALFIHGVNPVFDLPDGEALAGVLRKVPLVVSFAQRMDETAALTRYVLPDQHYLESWSDAEPLSGLVSVSQPTIHPLGDARSLLETIATWNGKPKPAYDILREHSKNIVILGGGVGGLVVANELRRTLRSEHHVTVIEKNGQHAFAPSFLWLTTGDRRPHPRR